MVSIRNLEISNDERPTTIFTYYNLDKEEWRSFDLCRFIGFVTFRELTISNIINQRVKTAKEKRTKKEN